MVDFLATIDISDDLLLLEVEKESKELLTINTHKKLFWFSRFGFGVKPAKNGGHADHIDRSCSIYWWHHHCNCISRWTFAAFIFYFSRIQQYGFRVKAEKREFFRDKIIYLGFIFDKNARKPGAENISTMENMPAPTNIKTSRSYLLWFHKGEVLTF